MKILIFYLFLIITILLSFCKPVVIPLNPTAGPPDVIPGPTSPPTTDRFPEEWEEYLVPVGSIIAFPGPALEIPVGWFLCDGTSLPRAQYPNLYNVISTYWGEGNEGSASFRLPDLRGMFLRGVNSAAIHPVTNFPFDAGLDTRSKHPSYKEPRKGSRNSVGSYQLDAMQTHSHQYIAGIYDGSHDNDSSGSPNIEVLAVQRMQEPDDARTSTETRPQNAYVHFLIKY